MIISHVDNNYDEMMMFTMVMIKDVRSVNNGGNSDGDDISFQ